MTNLNPHDVDPLEIEKWRTWIGKSESRTEILDVESLRRFAAAIGEDLDVEKTQPSLAHWAFFLPVVSPDQIGPDGHSKRGGFLPAITLPRRMFASSQMRFDRPLTMGRPATRTSVIADVKHKPGKSGDLVLVDVEHTITQGGKDCVVERQTIVYRGDGGRTPAVVAVEQAADPADVLWQPGPVDLFRFSAVTFNSHRIHYDHAYTTEIEGYPGLVVHGPFTAAKLYGYAAKTGGPLKAFAFRASAPLFVGQPVRLTGGDASQEVRAVRCDGVTAMSATVTR
ncbi:MAG: MaoC family dehydratase N-terminal domain-containing protein [Rhodospirillaceae bacterium]|nr:MaoC family dehydratase N-terminal domain-containing protein [Rhodospirillaceae bacterium]